MIHLLILAVHLLATIAKLVRPGGVPRRAWLEGRRGRAHRDRERHGGSQRGAQGRRFGCHPGQDQCAGAGLDEARRSHVQAGESTPRHRDRSEPVARRCASRGARSTSERRSCSARATAITSSTLPPEYISATTAPASGWPSTNAALIDTSAIASTPNRPARKSRGEPFSPSSTHHCLAACLISQNYCGSEDLLSTKRMANGRPASAPPRLAENAMGVQRLSAAVTASQ
jgi:hypothetical protein